MNIINKIKNKLIKLRFKLKKESFLEKRTRNELVESIKRIKGAIKCENAWERYRQKIRVYVLENDPRNFLRWEPIVSSMFHNANKKEFDHLVKKNKVEWLPIIKETGVGNPLKYRYYKKSSGNVIHTAYNLSQLIEHSKINLTKINSIVEFGAGYGCMANTIHKLSFNGTYTIFDIPEFSAIQRYYLHSNDTQGDFNFIDKQEELSTLNPDILIATWSLSEAPIDLRNRFLKKIGKPIYILIAYQEKFEGIDNVKYFQKYKENNNDYEWVDYEIEHIPGNYYLIGNKK